LSCAAALLVAGVGCIIVDVGVTVALDILVLALEVRAVELMRASRIVLTDEPVTSRWDTVESPLRLREREDDEGRAS
jgi:hypothetical protein